MTRTAAGIATASSTAITAHGARGDGGVGAAACGRNAHEGFAAKEGAACGSGGGGAEIVSIVIVWAAKAKVGAVPYPSALHRILIIGRSVAICIHRIVRVYY